jgi:pantothenate kinase
MDTAPVGTAELLARAARLGPGRHILGITGPPGAGKSTLAAELVERLGPDTAVLVGMDGFHLDDEILRAHGNLDRKGAIDTFDGDGYAALLERIAAAQPGDPALYAPRFDLAREVSIGGAGEIPSVVPLVVTEGNYLLAESGAWPRARAALSEVWFLDLDDETRLAQLIARHRSFGRSDDDARQRALGSDETNARLILSTRRRADLVVRWRRDEG